MAKKEIIGISGRTKNTQQNLCFTRSKNNAG